MINPKRMEKYEILSKQSYLIFSGVYSNQEELFFAPKEEDLNLAVQYVNMKLNRCIENYDRIKKRNDNPDISEILSEFSKYIYYANHLIAFAKSEYKLDIKVLYEYLIKNIRIAKSIIKLNLDLY